MLGLRMIDWLVIVAYLVGITVVGVWTIKKVTHSASYFIGDRKFGKWMMMFFTFGAGTHSDQAVSVAAKTYQVGASGIWYQWVWLFVTPFYWLISPFFRRMRAVTTGDYFEIRYGQRTAILYAIIGMLQLMVTTGVMLKGAGEMVAAVSNEKIPANVAIVAMTVMFVIYGVAGGMSAAIVTNFIQGLLTIVLSFLILPYAMDIVGGMSGLRDAISDPAMLKIVAPGEITLFFIIVVAFNSLIGWVTQPHSMANCAAGKTEMEGRVGVTFGMFLKRICTVAWMLTALCAIAIYTGAKKLDNPDAAYGIMARDILTGLMPGLVGLFIASMLAAVMSSCDSFMVAASGLFTNNIYRKVCAANKSESHYVLVGRISSVLIVLSGLLVAFALESVVHGLELFWKVAAMMGIAWWVGLFWRRATSAGAWTGTLVSFAVFLLTSRIAFLDTVLWNFNTSRLACRLPAFMLWQGKLHLPWQMILYLSTGFVSLVLVSLCTKRTPKERLDRIFACLRTPVMPGEEELEPFTLPAGVTPAPRNSLVKHPDFEIPKPTFVGIVGFLAAGAIVGLLIAAVFFIMRL
ncbi:MAG: sodium:solute symporter family protein [Sedimentisphaerales bacterium]|nr:sodium:solute symporter family protein [Sedimentisphaerales bacterium]